MLPNSTDRQHPQKRKHLEYHDPDYARSYVPACKRMCDLQNTDQDRNQKLRNIISWEFQREMDYRSKQIEQINDRLEKAFSALDRLRYAIVADYYLKQMLNLTPAGGNILRGAQTLFDDEPNGIQMPLHPAMKKIIGKKPKTYDILRTCSTRLAAQTAKQTIFVNSQNTVLDTKHDGGKVFDHSNGQDAAKFSKSLLAQNEKKLSGIVCSTHPSTCRILKTNAAVKTLNAARINNKTKYIIVVGNTSKYIGKEGQDSRGKPHSHKWLVYVQAKDTKTPFNSFIKKVRFFLHSSYRPNDVVDICSPPFQISRRGWGEFPIRIQMFFVDSLQQKPIQLVHHIVFDKTQSGLQTLGAETLVEIWLRSCQILQRMPISEENNVSVTESKHTKSLPFQISEEKQVSVTERKHTKSLPYVAPCNRKGRSQQKKDIDDNLFEFLNRIEESPALVCADIEKIQPTVVVSETVVNVDNTDCKQHSPAQPTENDNPPKSPLCVVSSCDDTDLSHVQFSLKQQSKALPPSPIKQPHRYISQESIPMIIADEKRGIKPETSNYTCAVDSTKDKSISVNVLKNEKNTNIRNAEKTVSVSNANLPTNTTVGPDVHSHTKLVLSWAAKKTLKKKLVQIVDVSGNVRHVQMLVAASNSTATTAAATTTSSLTTTQNTNFPTTAHIQSIKGPKAHPLTLQNSKVSSTSEELNAPRICNILKNPMEMQETNLKPKTFGSSNKHTRNVVFLKEGKVYIIDPLQVKLKQQQKKQVSLLKPQISLLKKKCPTQTPTLCDHDYLPAPIIRPFVRESKEIYKQALSASPLMEPYTLIKEHFQPLKTASLLHLGIKEARAKANHVFETAQHKQKAIERHFLDERFKSVREAVDYLLRRLPLVTNSANNAISSAGFPFLKNSLQQFNALPAFKQRALEWLRAKLIAKHIQSHKQLQNMNDPFTSSSLWTTREILIFARYHAYTPPMKDLKNTRKKKDEILSDLIKLELKNGKQIIYDTLTKNTNIYTWIENVLRSVTLHEAVAAENQIIDVINIGHSGSEDTYKLHESDVQPTYCNSIGNTYLSYPDNLEVVSELVAGICKGAGIHLQPEELCSDIIHPASLTLLATCLCLFFEKLLRLSLGQKALTLSAENIAAVSSFQSCIELQDIGRMVSALKEFDFLSNRHMGTSKSYKSYTESQ